MKFKDIVSAISKSWVVYLFLLPAMLSMALVVFYPLFKGIYFSFTDIDQYNMGNIFKEPSYKWIGFDNYKEVLGTWATPNICLFHPPVTPLQSATFQARPDYEGP